MNISEKKIGEIAIEMQKLGLINTGPTAFKRMLEAINITGKDGLLDVLEECLGALTGGMDGKWTEGVDAAALARDHLSQWRQK